MSRRKLSLRPEHLEVIGQRLSDLLQSAREATAIAKCAREAADRAEHAAKCMREAADRAEAHASQRTKEWRAFRPVVRREFVRAHRGE